ncbi:hypothetical protein Tco_0622748 [Tanacetum coccineum]
MFHAVINRINFDYAAFLWWDFMNNVKQKKFPKIADLMMKFLKIPKRIEEDYHSIKDDISLFSVSTTGDVYVRGMLILDAFLTKEIYATDDFKEYETVLMKGKKRKQNAGESSSPHKSLKITIRQQKVVEGNKDDDDFENREDEVQSHHNNHQEDDAPPKGEKRVKRHKASKSSNSARGSSSNHLTKDFITYVSKQQQQQEWDAWVEETVIDKDEVNLTAPTLMFPGIEAHEPYIIVDKPSTGLICLNNKDKKWVMYLTEIVKFCDATLEKVLKEVKIKIFQSEPWRKPPLLGELDRDILRAIERQITKRLSHREKMIRWESFMNGRPILPMMKHL